MIRVPYIKNAIFNPAVIAGRSCHKGTGYSSNLVEITHVKPNTSLLNSYTVSPYRFIHSARRKKPPAVRHSIQDVLNAQRRKLKRDEMGREKLISILNLEPKIKDIQHEIKSVDDLKKILPNMPYDQQVKVGALIEEYGDSLNACFKNVTELTNQQNNTLEQGLTESQPGISEYGAAIELIQGMAEEIIMLENEGEGLVKDSTYVNLWQNVKLFSQMERDPEIDPPLELLVILFQLAKNQSGSNIRTKSIRLVGDILYGLKLVRLDPYNEVDYLNSLVSSRRVNDALKIWKSRLSKDDIKGSIWWVEVGSCLYQEVYDLGNAEKLAAELIEKYDYVPPKVVSRFIKAYSETGKPEDAWRWCEYMMNKVKEAGHLGEEVNVTGDMEPEEAEIVFNQKTLPTEKDVIDALSLIVNSAQPTHSLQMIEKVNSANIPIPLHILVRTLRTIAKNANFADTEKTLHVISALRKIVSNEKLQNIVVGDNILDQVAYLLLESNPELRTSKKFYQEWIYGLVTIRQTDRVYDVLGEMSKNNVQPTQLTIQYVMKSLLNSNRLPEALELLEKMEKREQYSQYNLELPFPSPIHYSIMIQYAARRRNEELVLNILQRANDHLKKYDESIYLALFRYFYRTKHFTSFCKLLSIPLHNKFQTFSSEGYKTIWTIIRDYFRTYPKSYQTFTFFPKICSDEQDPVYLLAAAKNYNPTETIDSSIPPLKFLIFKMLKSSSFVPSLDVYERVLQTLLVTHDHVMFFALLNFISKNNQLGFDPAFAIRLTKLAEKMGKIQQMDPTMTARPPTISPVLFSATSVQSVAINDILKQSNNTSKIPLETLVGSISLALGFNYSRYKDIIDHTVSELTTPL